MAPPRKSTWHVEKLREERDRIIDQIDDLREQLAALDGQRVGINKAIDILLRGNDADAEDGAKSGRGEAKVLLLALLEEVGTDGLNANIAEGMARQRGVTLKLGTAASNLSRLKADGVIVHDGERYRLPKFARQPGLMVVSGNGS